MELPEKHATKAHLGDKTAASRLTGAVAWSPDHREMGKYSSR